MSTKLRFRDYELDPDNFDLRRAGHRIRLERKPMEMLILLAEKQGQLVEREEIIEKIWGKNLFFDTENAINNAIRKVRAALNDDSEQPCYIETSVGKGYRFIAPVEGAVETGSSPALAPPSVAPAPSSSPWRRAWIPGLGAMALIAAAFAFNITGIRNRISSSDVPIHSIAVLPLENLSGDSSQEYFVDGMTDALITDLAQMSDVKVISRTSVMQYKGARKPLPEIARALGVEAIVEGSVVRSGDKVRITAQLIYAPSDHHLWAESFEGPANDILSIQDYAAHAIAGRVRGKLGSRLRQTPALHRPINLDAYEAYLRGRYFFDKRGAEASQKSVDSFRKAIAADPEFAPAYAGLAEALPAMNWFNGKPPVQVMQEAKAAAKRALELDDNLGQAHTALGGLLCLYDWSWNEAQKELQRGLDLSPNDSLAHERYTMYLQSVGRLPEALLEAKRAQQLDPLSFFMNRELARSLYLSGNYDEALSQLRRSQELEPHSGAVISNWIRWTYERQGKQKEAIELGLSEMASQGAPQLEIISLRTAYARGGWKGYWTRWLQLYPPGKAEDYYTIAIAEARLGHADKTWQWMEKAADQREVFVTWIKVDPLFDNVRSHPTYKRLLRRINLLD